MFKFFCLIFNCSAPAARKDRRPLLFYSAFLECPIRNRNNPAIGDDSFQQALYPLLVSVAYGIAHDQAMALSHLIVFNSPIEDVGAYAFQRKL